MTDDELAAVIVAVARLVARRAADAHQRASEVSRWALAGRVRLREAPVARTFATAASRWAQSTRPR